MIRRLRYKLLDLFNSIWAAEFVEKSHKIEMVGEMYGKPVILTAQLHPFNPYELYGEHGHFYMTERKRKVRNENRAWIIVTEQVERYELSPGDKRFIYDMYVHYHLTAEQINKISGIPQPYIFRYIKHMKLKPKYRKIEKSQRRVPLDFGDLVVVPTCLYKNNVSVNEDKIQFDADEEVPEIDHEDPNIDFDEPFHVDPFPARSEWKVRREELGLKNGENWRNTPIDVNPGPRQFGDGSKSARRNLAKLARKEKRMKKNIKKFNLHQNNRYGMTIDHPEPTKDPYKQRREMLERKKNKGKESENEN